VTLTWSSVVRSRIQEAIHPTAKPIATPPAASAMKLAPASARENVPATTAANATR
jgi:hypothetical protein